MISSIGNIYVLWILGPRMLSLVSRLGSAVLGGTEQEQLYERVTRLSIKLSTRALSWNLSSFNAFLISDSVLDVC
jgi:hypothetical protein